MTKKTLEYLAAALSAILFLFPSSACSSWQQNPLLTIEEPTSLKRLSFTFDELRSGVDIPLSWAEAGFQFDGNLIWDVKNTRLVLSAEQGAPLERYFARNRKGSWVELLLSDARGSCCEKVVLINGNHEQTVLFPEYQTVRLDPGSGFHPTLSLIHRSSTLELEKKITPDLERDLFCIAISARIKDESEFQASSLESVYYFYPATTLSPPDFSWTPNLRPDPSDVIADHCFRSPAVVLQKKSACCGMMPDLSFLQSPKRTPTVLDLDCTHPDHPLISFGYSPWRTRGHVYYQRDVEKTLKEGGPNPVQYGFRLLLRADAPVKMGFREIVRSLWNLYGSPMVRKKIESQATPFTQWEDDFFHKKIQDSYVPVDLPGISGGLLRSQRLKSLDPDMTNDAWFSAWFQSMRTAYGMLVYSQRTGDETLRKKALSLVDLILCAPRKQGIFPSIFCLSKDLKSGKWLYDSHWAGYPDCYHAMDCAWTGYWLLRIAEIEKDYKSSIIDFLRPFAEFLVFNQLSSGAIPSFYDSNSLKPREDLLHQFPAETACSALFLSRFYSYVKKREYLESACQAMTFMAQKVISDHRWFDFENFLSSSRKPFDFYDQYTLQYPQSTLCMIYSSYAFLELYKETGDDRFRTWGEMVLDYLSLHQQVWSPPSMSRDLFGGVSVQNTDSEWSDARSALISELFYAYFRETGNIEYFERCCASLHSVFAISPHVSWGRFAENRPGGLHACVHRGTGSAITSSVLLRYDMGDMLVDMANSTIFSIVSSLKPILKIDKYSISLEFPKPVILDTPLIIKFINSRFGVYELMINGSDLGTYSAKELTAGIDVKPFID